MTKHTRLDVPQNQPGFITSQIDTAPKRAVIADLERIKRLGVSPEAEAEINSIIERFRKTTG